MAIMAVILNDIFGTVFFRKRDRISIVFPDPRMSLKLLRGFFITEDGSSSASRNVRVMY